MKGRLEGRVGGRFSRTSAELAKGAVRALHVIRCFGSYKHDLSALHGGLGSLANRHDPTSSQNKQRTFLLFFTLLSSNEDREKEVCVRLRECVCVCVWQHILHVQLNRSLAAVSSPSRSRQLLLCQLCSRPPPPPSFRKAPMSPARHFALLPLFFCLSLQMNISLCGLCELHRSRQGPDPRYPGPLIP